MNLQVNKNTKRRVPRCGKAFRTKEQLGEKYVVDTEDRQDIKTRIRNARLSGRGIPENWRSNRVQDLRAFKQEIENGRVDINQRWKDIPASLKVKIKQKFGIEEELTPQKFVELMPEYSNKLHSELKAKMDSVKAVPESNSVQQKTNPNEESGTTSS